MSEEFKGKSGKVKVMYVRSDDDSETRSQNPRTGKGGGRPAASGKGDRRPRRDDKPGASRDRYNDRDAPSSSPWRTVSRPPRDVNDEHVEQSESTEKGYVDREVIRRQRAEETRVYGENACQALFQSRPDSIVRAWFIQSVTPRFKEALRWMAAMRSCAHFGVKGLLVEDASLLESGAAVRTAEGGAEHVQAISGDHFSDGLERFRQAGYAIVTTSSHKGTALYQSTLPKKMVLVLGQERDGVSDATFDNADMRIAIPGSGNVESLNVSVATGVLLAEWWRQNKA